VSNITHSVPDSMPQAGPSGSPPDRPEPPTSELEVLNDDVMIPLAPERPGGTIHVTLAYEGRSTPIPAEDPWAE
jgi:hypothetical protein